MAWPIEYAALGLGGGVQSGGGSLNSPVSSYQRFQRRSWRCSCRPWMIQMTARKVSAARASSSMNMAPILHTAQHFDKQIPLVHFSNSIDARRGDADRGRPGVVDVHVDFGRWR